MKVDYCLPIIKTKTAEVERMLKDAKDYQFLELWVDYIEDINFDFLEKLMQEYRERLIIVFRRQNLETTIMEAQKRLSIISSLENAGCLLDLDVITQQEELNYILSNGLRIPLITSYHNYQQTPEDKKLIEVISIMMNYNPSIFKIATKCNKPKDALRLLDLLISLKNEDKRYIILGMGEYGTLTRIFGALWGNEIVFAPVEKANATAPGQLTKQEMETVLGILSANT